MNKLVRFNLLILLLCPLNVLSDSLNLVIDFNNEVSDSGSIPYYESSNRATSDPEQIYFEARVDKIGTKKLWVTDGTVAGTNQLDTPSSNSIYDFEVVANKLIYMIDSEERFATTELWMTDGTTKESKLLHYLSRSDFPSFRYDENTINN